MGYEALGEVKTVKLGGTDPKTGKRNPTEIEGYFVGTETRPNKFNKEKPQKFYTFKTKHGLEGIYGKGGLDKLMSSASLGTMTKVVDTGELKDVGKGQPMKVYKVFQDKGNSIEVDEATVSTEASEDDATSYREDDDSNYESDTPEDEVRHVAPAAPARPAAVATASSQKRVQDILNRSKRA